MTKPLVAHFYFFVGGLTGSAGGLVAVLTWRVDSAGSGRATRGFSAALKWRADSGIARHIAAYMCWQ